MAKYMQKVQATPEMVKMADEAYNAVQYACNGCGLAQSFAEVFRDAERHAARHGRRQPASDHQALDRQVPVARPHPAGLVRRGRGQHMGAGAEARGRRGHRVRSRRLINHHLRSVNLDPRFIGRHHFPRSNMRLERSQRPGLVRAFVEIGERIPVIACHSEVMIHFGLAGKPIEVELVADGDDAACQVYKRGERFSTPIMPSEGGFYATQLSGCGDGRHGYYTYADVNRLPADVLAQLENPQQ